MSARDCDKIDEKRKKQALFETMYVSISIIIHQALYRFQIVAALFEQQMVNCLLLLILFSICDRISVTWYAYEKWCCVV